MATAEHKHLNAPDETRTFEKGKIELLNIGGGQVGRLTLEPGWRWSEHVKPIAETEWCEAPHFQYHVAGRLHVVMADGTEFDAGRDRADAPRGAARSRRGRGCCRCPRRPGDRRRGETSPTTRTNR